MQVFVLDTKILQNSGNDDLGTVWEVSNDDRGLRTSASSTVFRSAPSQGFSSLTMPLIHTEVFLLAHDSPRFILALEEVGS